MRSVLGGFLAAAAADGDRIAVSGGGRSLTYGQVDAAAAALAARLAEAGVVAGDVVGVRLDRQPLTLVAILALLRLRAAYLPLDPAHPRERERYVLDRSGARLVLTDHASDGSELVVDLDDLATVAPHPVQEAEPGDTAYVIFTSGTTGRPKGVLIDHAGLVGHLRAKIADLSLAPSDVVAQTASQCFDISLWQFLAPICAGASVTIVDSATQRDPGVLSAHLRRCGVTVAQFVPSLLRVFLGGPREPLPDLRVIATVGEQLPPDTVARWFERYPGVPLLNHYGPTECADGVTHHLLTEPLSPDERWTPIGRPIPGLTTHVVAPGTDDEVAVGEVGELLVVGAGVGRYAGEAGVAGGFVANPFGPGRAYRTGDLARLRSDGLLECHGRLDRQVKVRGHRIELAEIETVLEQHPAVRAAAVVLRTGTAEKLTARETLVAAEEPPARLVGYLQWHDVPATRADLHAHAARLLPDHMIPEWLVEVDSFPLSANGKLDHAALPAPELQRPFGAPRFVEPLPGPQTLVRDIWAEVLGVGLIGRHDRFVELGGDSLTAIRVVNRLRAQGTAVSVGDLFDSDLESLAERVGGVPPQEHRAPVPADAEVPPTSLQRQLWFLWQLDPSSCDYVLQAAVEIDGPLDYDAMRETWTELVRRFDTLRARFPARDGRPLLVVDDPFAPDVEVSDSPLPQRRAEELAFGFDLERGRLFRLVLFRHSAVRHTLLLTTHEIVMDAWSLSVLTRHLRSIYASLTGGTVPLPPPAIGLRDYAAYEPEPASIDRDYWATQLKGDLIPTRLPHCRGARKADSAGTSAGVWLDSLAARRLRDVAAAANGTLYSVLVTGVLAVLHRYTGQEDLIIGSPHVVREEPGTEDLLGFFLNMLPIRASVRTEDSMVDLHGRVRETVRQALSHARYPFSAMVADARVDRGAASSPVFQVMVNVYSEKAEPVVEGDLRVRVRELETGHTKYDLTIYAQEEADGIYLQASWRIGVLPEGLGASVLAALAEALQAIPSTQVGELPLPTAQIAGVSRPLRSEGLAALFTAQARETPDAVALLGSAGSVTFADLHAEVMVLAETLRGLDGDQPVLVADDRLRAGVVAVLACVLAGRTYAVLPEHCPPARAAEITAHLGPSAVVESGQVRVLGGSRGADLADVLHVVYTSGSTGAPKGVVVPESAVLNRLEWMWRALPFADGEVVVLQKSLSLVASTWELFGGLLRGVPTVLVSGDELRDPDRFLGLLECHRVTRLLASPPVLSGLLEAGRPGRARDLRVVTSSTEELPPALAARWYRDYPDTTLYNLYGSTECSSNAAWHEVDRDRVYESIPLGQAVDNVTLVVLDEHGAPVPAGAVGEIGVLGACLASGYWHDDALTARHFGELGGARLYRTGDRGRINARGELEFAGRADHQVKIRGYRVELDEVARALSLHSGSDAAAHWWPGEELLVGYVTAGAEGVRAAVASTLPAYMVPARIVTLPALPRGSAGKLDRSRLPLPVASVSDVDDPPVGDAERTIAAVWVDLLRIEVTRGTDFFAAGGDSMMSVRCVTRLRHAGLQVRVADLHDAPVLRDLAQAVNRAELRSVIAPGEIGLSPTALSMHRLQGFAEHYNMCDCWEFGQDGPSGAALSSALGRLVAAYPSLAAAMTPDLALRVPFNSQLHLEEHDLTAAVDPSAVVGEIARAAQHEFRFDGESPLIRLIRFDAGERTWVLLLVHHFLLDGYAYRLLITDLERFLADPTALPTHDDGAVMRAWTSGLERACTEHAEEITACWSGLPWDELDPSRLTWVAPAPAPVDPSAGAQVREMLAAGTRGPDFEDLCDRLSVRYVHLDQPTTDRLLARFGPVGLHDALMVALTLELGAGERRRALWVDSLMMGRTPVLPGVDLSSALAFTAELVPFPCIVDAESTVDEQVALVAHHRHTAPLAGISFRAMRELPGLAAHRETFRAFPAPRVVLNHRAPLGAMRSRTLTGATQANIFVGDPMPPNQQHWLRTHVDFADGALRLFVQYSRMTHPASRTFATRLTTRLQGFA
ncbi:amino acid adenylation domain-containing protein [Actinokineospora baliensis]|uniref:non-ribosomal peptide synthetase n=1 Tax=Actinokineospora baliensis TaxID=547056 RepID=UPI0019573B2C|nr:non-ribosomal peptide synthetase [Actinokineospora baliensis]MBM7774819.1 amino acid adenylation domain-containing protein [Actinokineospora baliensis]